MKGGIVISYRLVYSILHYHIEELVNLRLKRWESPMMIGAEYVMSISHVYTRQHKTRNDLYENTR